MQKFQYIGSLEPYDPIVTENPIEEVWHLIDFFTAEETISTCNPPVDKELITFICESIAQAEEFRQSASVSGEHTGPLLTYYSIHNLTKAVLAIETNKRPPGYHGLMKVEVPQDETFPGTSVQVNDGVFSELLTFKKVGAIKNQRIMADDLIKHCGYLINEYRLAYDKNSAVIVPKVDADFHLNKLKLSFKKRNEITKDNLKDTLPSLTEHFEIVEGESDTMTFSLKETVKKGDLESIHKVLKEALAISVFSNPPYFLIPRSSPCSNWPQEAHLYALSFILCSLVRYYPDYWYKNVIAHKRNRWIVRKINNIIERVYPNLMLNIMFGYRMYRFAPTFF